MQIMTEQENRLPAVDGISFTRYPSIDAQTVEMTITKVQLGYMRVRNGSSSTEGSLISMGFLRNLEFSGTGLCRWR